MVARAVKGVRRTLILILDRGRRQTTLEAGTKRNRSCSASFHIRENIVFRVPSSMHFRDWAIASTLPGFYPHSEWATWARCILGSDFTFQVRHQVADLELLGRCHLTGDLEGSGGHSQSPEQGSGCCFQLATTKEHVLHRSTTELAVTLRWVPTTADAEARTPLR